MAIKNIYTIDEHRSELVRIRVFDCHLSPDWRSKTPFLVILIHPSWLLRAFLIAAYLAQQCWYRCSSILALKRWSSTFIFNHSVKEHHIRVCVQVLFNLVNKLRKRDQMLGFADHFSFPPHKSLIQFRGLKYYTITWPAGSLLKTNSHKLIPQYMYLTKICIKSRSQNLNFHAIISLKLHQ